MKVGYFQFGIPMCGKHKHLK